MIHGRLVMLLRLIVVVLLAESAGWPQLAPPPQLPPGVAIRTLKMQTITTASSTGSIAGVGNNPNRLPLPTDGSAVRIERRQLQVYSMELSNDGPKAIKALAWDFIFSDTRTFVQLLRHSFANVQKIDSGQKKTVKFTTALSPPKLVDAATPGKDPKMWFRESAQLQCVLFADGSTWERPEATGKPCDRLQHWIEQRKKSQSGLEDLPFNP